MELANLTQELHRSRGVIRHLFLTTLPPVYDPTYQALVINPANEFIKTSASALAQDQGAMGVTAQQLQDDPRILHRIQNIHVIDLYPAYRQHPDMFVPVGQRRLPRTLSYPMPTPQHLPAQTPFSIPWARFHGYPITGTETRTTVGELQFHPAPETQAIQMLAILGSVDYVNNRQLFFDHFLLALPPHRPLRGLHHTIDQVRHGMMAVSIIQADVEVRGCNTLPCYWFFNDLFTGSELNLYRLNRRASLPPDHRAHEQDRFNERRQTAPSGEPLQHPNDTWSPRLQQAYVAYLVQHPEVAGINYNVHYPTPDVVEQL